LYRSLTRGSARLVALALACALPATVAASASAHPGPARGLPEFPPGGGFEGAVYTETNSTAGNTVLVFDREPSGALVAAGSSPTGGTGTGTGLGSGHSVVASASGRFVVAVNAGSNSISVFRAGRGGLTQVGEATASGGTTPTSVTISGRLVYVMNAGSGTISGFWLSDRWGLIPIAGSTQPLAAADTATDSQIQFSRDGNVLIVDERGTANLLQTFVVGPGGIAGPGASVAADAGAPFGFDVDDSGHVLFSNAAFGTSSAASSYDISDTGALTPNGPPVSSGQAAACWLAAVGGFAYTDNAGSGSIGRYAVASDGDLTLTGTTLIASTAHPLDMVGVADRFLYVLANGESEILGYRVSPDGDLAPVAQVAVPAGVDGLGGS